jgi:hypothetical protein
VRQQPGPVIPLIAARTEEQFRDNLAATDLHLSQQHLDRLDALSRPTLGFPADVMRDSRGTAWLSRICRRLSPILTATFPLGIDLGTGPQSRPWAHRSEVRVRILLTGAQGQTVY